jgi:hypothetical protein
MEGFDGNGSAAFGICTTARSSRSSLYGEVQHIAGVMCGVAFARVTARCSRALSMESWLVALSTAKGEGLSGREP